MNKRKKKIFIILTVLLCIIVLRGFFYCYTKGIRPSNISIINDTTKLIKKYNNNDLSEVYEHYNINALYKNKTENKLTSTTYPEFKAQSQKSFLSNRAHLAKLGITFHDLS